MQPGFLTILPSGTATTSIVGQDLSCGAMLMTSSSDRTSSFLAEEIVYFQDERPVGPALESTRGSITQPSRLYSVSHSPSSTSMASL